MNCLVIQHVAFEDLGSLETALRDLGFTLEIWEAGLGLPPRASWLDADLCVVLGGPIGVYDTDFYSWIATEQRLVADRIAAERPLLGVCLGGQFIAKALGAEVAPAGCKELGWSELALTEAGMVSPLRHFAGIPVLHWHGDAFALPGGSQLLASSSITPHQAFSRGKKLLALQFHPEMTPEAMERWLIGNLHELRSAGIDPRELREDGKRYAKALCCAAYGMMEEWVAGWRQEAAA